MDRFVKAATAASLPWLAALAVAGTPATSMAQSSSCLAPSGGDDTAALQAALESCSGAAGSCTVRLCARCVRDGDPAREGLPGDAPRRGRAGHGPEGEA